MPAMEKGPRPIAALGGPADIGRHHVQEAVGYRNLDRDTWGLR